MNGSTDFDVEVRDLVADTAPRLFAVVRKYTVECGETDAHVAGWGLAYEDGTAHALSYDGRHLLSLGSPERATVYFARSGEETWLVWPEAV